MAEENLGLDLASQTGQEDIVEAINGLKNLLQVGFIKTSEVDLISQIITQNGSYNPFLNNQAYKDVTVNVPNSYSTDDEEKVISNGELVNQSPLIITQNGVYNTALNNEVTVDIENANSVIAFLKIIYEPGSICSISNNNNLINAPDTSGSWIAEIPNAGEWLVSVLRETDQKSLLKNISITYGDSQSIDMLFNVDRDYVEVEYIQSGTVSGAFINTGLLWSSQRYFELTYQFPENISGEQWIFGFYGNSYTEISRTDSTTTFYINSSSRTKSSDLLKHTISVIGNKFTYDNLEESISGLGNPSSYSVLLFGRSSNANGGLLNNKTALGCRIYHCKLYDGNSIVRDLYPCYRKSDNEPGMFDSVNRVFYPNAGSQSFILGPAV